MLSAWLMSFGRHGAGSGFGWFCEIGQSGSNGLFGYLSKTVQKDDDWGQSSLACSFLRMTPVAWSQQWYSMRVG